MVKSNFRAFLFTLPALLMIMLVSCDPGRKYEKEETSAIKDYLSSNFNITFDLKPSGLYYHEVVAGSGPSPVAGDTVFVQYAAKFLSGLVLDPGPAAGTPMRFVVGDPFTIQGFDEALKLMKAGGKATFLIPSSLAYGPAGYIDQYYGIQVIPGYTPLLYDIELVRIKSPSGK